MDHHWIVGDILGLQGVDDTQQLLGNVGQCHAVRLALCPLLCYDKTTKYSLVFLLHGAGERGEDLDVACRHGFMKHVREEGKEYPFIFVATQCPYQKYWGCFTESLLAFLDYICSTMPVDKDRVYLTGYSWRYATV